MPVVVGTAILANYCRALLIVRFTLGKPVFFYLTLIARIILKECQSKVQQLWQNLTLCSH